MKIYIACSLTHVPRDEFTTYVSFIHDLAAHLAKELSAEVKYALQDSDPQLALKPFHERARLCYVWDRQMVEWANVVVAEASHPSTGLGIELQIAETKDTPIVITFRATEQNRAPPAQYKNPDSSIHNLQLGDGYVSLMALGLPSVFRVIPYVDSSCAHRDIATALHEIDQPN